MFDRRLYIDISSATEEMKEAIVRAAAEKGYDFPSGRDGIRIPSYADYIYLRPHIKMITYSRNLVGSTSGQIHPTYSTACVATFETAPTEIHMHGRKYVLVPE